MIVDLRANNEMHRLMVTSLEIIQSQCTSYFRFFILQQILIKN